MQRLAALVEVFMPLFGLQMGIVVVDLFLRALVAAPKSWAELRRALNSLRISPVYGLLLGGILLLQLVVPLIFVLLDIPTAVLQTFVVYFYLGLMLLLIVTPLVGLYGLLRYYACAQGLGMLVGVCMWPALATHPYRLWFGLGSLLCYTLLFVVTAQWRRPKG
jgi:hypothetical protein